VNFLATLAGAAKRIVCDQSNTILAAIPTAWPKAADAARSAHYHLKEQAKRLIPARMTDGRKALEDAFYSTRSWDYLRTPTRTRHRCRSSTAGSTARGR